tara:strand:- start:3547 stop:4257 length:711 start_codon:yes stop_codon:yes gene_type:complete
MNENTINYIIIGFIITYLVYQDCKKSILKKEKMMNLDDIPELDIQPKVEITNLVKCEPLIFFELNDTFNHVINDGKKIYINTLKPLRNKTIYDGHRYNLSNIEFHPGTTTFNRKKVHLELHLLFTSTVNDYILRTVFPLSLVDVIEHFKAINHFKQKKKDKNIIHLLNYHIIPPYVCCSPNVGKLTRIDLNDLNGILNNNKFFYKYEPNKKSVWFYTKPKKYNKMLGKKILEMLQR